MGPENLWRKGFFSLSKHNRGLGMCSQKKNFHRSSSNHPPKASFSWSERLFKPTSIVKSLFSSKVN